MKKITAFFTRPENSSGTTQQSESPSTSSTLPETLEEETIPTKNAAEEANEIIKPPFHPHAGYEFKKTAFGKQKRSCQSHWFANFAWLHYRKDKDDVICYICSNQNKRGNLESVSKKEITFISSGFSKWKKAIECFSQHQNSECHKTAVAFEITSSSCKDIVEMTQDNAKSQRAKQRKYFLKLLRSLQYLARQGLPLQGDSGDGNFDQLLLLLCKDETETGPQSNSFLLKYNHHDYQNELLDIMARQVLNKKLCEIQKSPFYALIADEYTDISNKEQVSICVRWIDQQRFETSEDFLGFYEVDNIKSETIVNVIQDSLIRMQLPISKLRGQTYDGAGNMMGKKSGVAKRIKDLQPKALETHCHGHSLNLSVKDVTSKSEILHNTMGTVSELTILIKFSPKRERLLGDIQANIEGVEEDLSRVITMDKLCPTRWTVKAKCYGKVIELYDELYRLFRDR